ncbi:MAG TPA: VWA domain-containing protein [Vicinamibacterales bacterium]|nr:VWA domain-containing protein [Vicinamibacterales bacterium]
MFVGGDPVRQTFRARTDLVQIDVVVTDEHGQPVHGLSKEDFVLLDRRKPQAVALVDEISRTYQKRSAQGSLAKLAPPDVADNRGSAVNRLVVLVIDDTHIWTGRTDRVKEIARRIVSDFGGEAAMGLLLTGGDHEVEVTNDSSALLRAIDSFKGRQATRRPNEGCVSACACTSQGGGIQGFYNDLGLYKKLQEAATLLTTSERRRKAFVLISEYTGKEVTGVFESGEAAPITGLPVTIGNPGTAAIQGQKYSTPDEARLANPPVDCRAPLQDYSMLDMMSTLRAADVATYSIDPRGQVSTQDLTRECSPVSGSPDACVGEGGNAPQDWISWVRRAQRGLELISKASGGFAIVNTDDFGAGIDRILQELDNYYVLAFYPADPGGNGFKPVEVQVKRPGLTIRYQRGYGTTKASAQPTTNPLVRLSTEVLPTSRLPLRLWALPLPGVLSTNQIVVAFEVRPARAPLVISNGNVRDTLRYGLLAVDLSKKKTVSYTEHEAHIVLKPTDVRASEQDEAPYLIVTAIRLPPGRYQLRASALSTGLGSSGSVYLDLDNPDFNRSPIAIGGILLAPQSGPAIPVAETTLARGVLPFDPSLERELDRHDPVRVVVPVGGSSHSSLSAKLELRSPDGQIVQSVAGRIAEPPVSPGGAASNSRTTGRTIQGVLDLGGLPPGPYILHVGVSDGKLQDVRELGVIVR